MVIHFNTYYIHAIDWFFLKVINVEVQYLHINNVEQIN